MPVADASMDAGTRATLGMWIVKVLESRSQQASQDEDGCAARGRLVKGYSFNGTTAQDVRRFWILKWTIVGLL